MSTNSSLATVLATALRAARKARGLTITELAQQGGVSPRLVSEFELGRRSHVSLETALRLLQLVDVPITITGSASTASIDAGQAERAARRRITWTGEKTTLAGQAAPSPPISHAARLVAVAQASRLTVGLRSALNKQTAGEERPVTKRSARTSQSR